MANAVGLAATGILIFFGNKDATWVGFGIMFLMNVAGYLAYIIRMALTL